VLLIVTIRNHVITGNHMTTEKYRSVIVILIRKFYIRGYAGVQRFWISFRDGSERACYGFDRMDQRPFEDR
jgi:hypothetical protein